MYEQMGPWTIMQDHRKPQWTMQENLARFCSFQTFCHLYHVCKESLTLTIYNLKNRNYKERRDLLWTRRDMCHDQSLNMVLIFDNTFFWSERPYYYREVISVFWFGGSKTCLPSPKGGRQTKSCSDGKTCLAKVDRSAQVTLEKWPPFLIWGV